MTKPLKRCPMKLERAAISLIPGTFTMPMDLDQQQKLRDGILALCFDMIDADTLNTVSCFVACMGAAAVCAAVLPKESRDKLVDAAVENLAMHADKRADEMRSGAFDREIKGH